MMKTLSLSLLVFACVFGALAYRQEQEYKRANAERYSLNQDGTVNVQLFGPGVRTAEKAKIARNALAGFSILSAVLAVGVIITLLRKRQPSPQVAPQQQPLASKVQPPRPKEGAEAPLSSDPPKQSSTRGTDQGNAPSGTVVSSSTAKHFTFEGEISLPQGVREAAVVMMERYSAEQNHKEVGARVLSEQWEAAFPFALAEVMQSGSPVAMKYVGACLLKTVERNASSGALSPKDKDYIAGAIRCLSAAIDHGEADWDAYQFRGASRLIAAQLNRDRTALDAAERDFNESKRINPSPIVDRNLTALQGVRQRMF